MKVFPGPPCFIILLGSSTCSCYWRHDCCSMNFEVNSRVEMIFFSRTTVFYNTFGLFHLQLLQAPLLAPFPLPQTPLPNLSNPTEETRVSFVSLAPFPLPQTPLLVSMVSTVSMVSFHLLPYGKYSKYGKYGKHPRTPIW